MRRRKSLRERLPAAESRPDACARRAAQSGATQGSCRCHAEPHQLGSPTQACSAIAHGGMLVCLACARPVLFGHRYLLCRCAHTERSAHACIVPHIAVVMRSERFAIVCVSLCVGRVVPKDTEKERREKTPSAASKSWRPERGRGPASAGNLCAAAVSAYRVV